MATAAVVDPLHAGPTQARRYQRKIAFAAGAFSQGRTAAAATAAATTAPSAGLSGDNPIDVHVDTSAGEPLALYCAVDQRGHVFAFDLVQNK